MKKSNLFRSLQIAGKKIVVIHSDGNWYVAVKPICEVLNVEYTRAFKNLKTDKILSQLLAEQPIVGADGKRRNMLCLPEKYVYGWLFSINSASPELEEYKLQCYDILYGHFHGNLSYRYESLNELEELDYQLQQAKEELQSAEAFQKIQELKERKTTLGKRLRKLDNDLLNGQMAIL